MKEIIYTLSSTEDENDYLEFNLNFNPDDHLYINMQEDNLPPWTVLENNKCENCPLDCEYCPVAANIFDFVEKCSSSKSFESYDVEVITPARTYKKTTDLQTALFSMMGLVMASSDCPHLKFLRPMAVFHLPFSTVDETMYRVASTHLMDTHFREKNNLEHSSGLEGLKTKYDKVKIVNKGLTERIKSVAEGDANKNAIYALTLFIDMFQMEFNSDFSKLEKLFLGELAKPKVSKLNLFNK